MALSTSSYVSATAWVEIIKQSVIPSQNALVSINLNIQNLANVLTLSNTQLGSILSGLTALQTSLATVVTAIQAQTSAIANPMIHIKGAANDPTTAGIVGQTGPYGTQHCQNDTTGGHWYWDGSSWLPY